MRPPVPLLLAAALSSAALAVHPLPTVAASAAGLPAAGLPTGGSPTPADAACAAPVQPGPEPAYRVRRDDPAGFAAAAEANDLRPVALARLAANDDTLWLDECGVAFYRDRGVVVPADLEAGPEEAARAALPAGTDVLALESDPGARRTIFLDVTGGTVSGTAWNTSGPIKVAPYSLTAPVDTSFSAAERTAIHDAWSVVAEDFAPFSVNVTTREPRPGEVERSGTGDDVYGVHVYLTQDNPVGDGCGGCAGVAYLDVVGEPSYLPAWVFTDGLPAGNGDVIGDIASHEAGHTFGLKHDGDRSSEYHWGNDLWSPVMGGSTAKRLTQWSQGDYPGATTKQLDLDVIARRAPRRADAHGDTSGTAAPLTGSASGLVGDPADVDAFTFSASGATTLQVRPTSEHPNLDVRLTVLDAAGAVVAVVDPPARRLGSSLPAGLDATWSVELPATPARYTALVDGTGRLTPGTGGYTDYGSLGPYRVTLSTAGGEAPPPDPDGPAGVAPPTWLTDARLPVAQLRRSWSAKVRVAGDGTTFTWRRTGTLPRGVRATPSATGRAMLLSGRPQQAGRFEVRFAVTDEAGQRVARTFLLRVRRP